MAVAYAPLTGVRVECIGVALDAAWFADFIDATYREFGHLGLFQTLGAVKVIEPNHPEAPAALRWSPTNTNPDEAYYDPATKTIWISGQADPYWLFLHEFWHHVQKLCGVLPDGTHAGKAMQALYVALTGNSDRPWEFMATDFGRSFFDRDPFPGSDAYFHACAALGGF